MDTSELSSQAQMQNDTDIRLLEATRDGDKQAFATLYRRFYPQLTRFAYRFLKEPSLIEEVVNDTMLTTWQTAADFRGESRVSTWVMGIVMRKCWQAARQSTKRNDRIVRDVIEQEAQDNGLDYLDDRQAIDNAMTHLSADQRSCVELAYQCGYTCEEIGQIMECPTNTVKTRLFHARKIFRKAFNEEQKSNNSLAGNPHANK